MTSEVGDLLTKARRSVKAAQTLLDTGDPDFAAARAYYAMFYLAEAMLLVRGLAYSKHSGVIAGFGREFAATREVDEKHHARLGKAFKIRQAGDYGDAGMVSEADARECIEWAREFLAMAEEWLERNDIEEGAAG
jgi:uncharacterized protein (UPF0332 family)